ncbi:MAG: hypothetical protein LBU68_00605 [Rickettsiales bacterium]|jgi:hypothetical protein|nr:hypothetical protein [Rickettsiales bacterium]
MKTIKEKLTLLLSTVIFSSMLITSNVSAEEKSIIKEKPDCGMSCNRPMSDSKTCEKQGEHSIGCINYNRCVEKCEAELAKKNAQF